MDKLKWLKERQKGIGGSDVAGIFGLSKYSSPRKIYLEKTEEITEVKEESESAYWGTVFEDIVAKEFEKRTGKKVRKDNRHLVHKDYHFMVANIDRRVVRENAILECKTANQFLTSEWEGDNIPASYILQVQHYLAVTGCERCYIAYLIGGQKFNFKIIERDEELISTIIKREKEFWKMVEDRTIPDITGNEYDTEYINKKYPNSEDDVIQIPNSFISMLESKKEIDNTIKELQEQSKTIENKIKEQMGTTERAVLPGYEIKWKSSTTNRLDSKKLKTELPDIYKKYCKESISRRFTIKEAN